MAEAKKMKLDDNVSKCEGSGKYELSDDTKAVLQANHDTIDKKAVEMEKIIPEDGKFALFNADDKMVPEERILYLQKKETTIRIMKDIIECCDKVTTALNSEADASHVAPLLQLTKMTKSALINDISLSTRVDLNLKYDLKCIRSYATLLADERK